MCLNVTQVWPSFFSKRFFLGYQYKPDTIHFKKKRQVLRCEGKTHQYDDIDTKGINATIVPCEETKGCTEIRQDPTRTVVKLKSCSKRGNLLSAGCEQDISCKKGNNIGE